MGTLVKICGINTPTAAEAALSAGADFAGLVFYPRSPRRVTAAAARPLADQMRGRLKLVVLAVDAADDAIAAALDAVRPDYLQLHGTETAERICALRTRFGVKIIKAVAVSAPADIARAAGVIDAADMLLFDAKAPAGADRPGGLGRAFDWEILNAAHVGKPWLLAGGLTAENVGRAVALSHAPGVDVSSGVESAPGVKDSAMIAAFVAAVRQGEVVRNV